MSKIWKNKKYRNIAYNPVKHLMFTNEWDILFAPYVGASCH